MATCLCPDCDWHRMAVLLADYDEALRNANTRLEAELRDVTRDRDSLKARYERTAP